MDRKGLSKGESVGFSGISWVPKAALSMYPDLSRGCVPTSETAQQVGVNSRVTGARDDAQLVLMSMSVTG